MSAVKILALVFLVLAVSVEAARGGSIHSSDHHRPHHSEGRRDFTAPTTLVFADQTHSPRTFAAENLAGSSNAPVTSNSGGSGGQVGSISGLSLGVTGNGNSGSSGNSSPSPGSSGTAPSAANSNSAPPDAFINFGSGPYSEASSLTTGNAQAFFNSPAFTHLFNGGPTSTDINHFENEVLATIQSTYNNAGLAINLTTDPNAHAAHTMSVVSGASYSGNPNAIGITDVGNNGFSFIDKFGAAQSVDQLAIAVGHNLSHELMHAFGIANHPEQDGPYVDAATATFQTLADPNTAFSPAAAALLSTLNFQNVGQSVTAGLQKIDGDQILVGTVSFVPEPSTIAVWGMLAVGLLVANRRRKVA